MAERFTDIYVYVTGESARISRSHRTPIGGQGERVRLVFEFDDSWAGRDDKVCTALCGGEMYSASLDDGKFVLPRCMCVPGELLFKVRGYTSKTLMRAVVRNNELWLTDGEYKDDEKARAYTDMFGRFVVGTGEGMFDANVVEKTNGHVVITDRSFTSDRHDVKHKSSTYQAGYMEASNIGDPIYIGKA